MQEEDQCVMHHNALLLITEYFYILFQKNIKRYSGTFCPLSDLSVAQWLGMVTLELVPAPKIKVTSSVNDMTK